ncbi:MAG TPA: PAS sensor protein [Sulfurospirillum cavolei]|uniref:PAS sensor protein n=1 Tax=Sulfurospirillum cavolei TaxID=366522 RepID=A0A2D3WDE9_9BACT|nr:MULTISPECIES: PAS domain-containing protein [Sulfurospirillum]DAB35754.1 MAG TPA: PAS sensor protein [Sulfurospirillum cavolei]
MAITQKGNELFFGEDQFVVSKTDLKGKITYVNDLCIEMCGYTEKEMIGAPHNILRHPDMPRAIFKLLWDKVQAGDEIFAYVKNRTKSGQFYWVHAYITPIVDTRSAKIIGYHSVRRCPNPKGLSVIEPLYRQMLEAEKSGGMQSSLALLDNTLAKLKVSYAEFILSYE